MSIELRRVKEELTVARKELSYLDTNGTEEIYAVALPTFEPMQWRWRIQLPNEGNCCVRSAFDQIPFREFPVASETDADIFIGRDGKQFKGPFILTIAVHKNEAKQWVITTKVDGKSYTIPIRQPPVWLDTNSFLNWQTSVGGSNGTESSKPTERLTLLRYRKGIVKPGRTSIDMQPTDGMLFWIETVEQARKRK